MHKFVKSIVITKENQYAQILSIVQHNKVCD